MLPWLQRRQRTTWRRHEAQVNERAAVPIATDEKGVGHTVYVAAVNSALYLSKLY